MSGYIVTTKRPVEIAEGFYSQPDHVSRREVATLDEARAYVIDLGAGAYGADTAQAIIEQGGSDCPLPDGALIEVVRVEAGKR